MSVERRPTVAWGIRRYTGRLVSRPGPLSPPLGRTSLVRLLLVVAGLLLVGYLTLQIGPDAIWSAFRSLSWGLVLILIFPTCLVVLADTLAWHFTFLRPPRSFARLLGVRLAGDA